MVDGDAGIYTMATAATAASLLLPGIAHLVRPRTMSASLGATWQGLSTGSADKIARLLALVEITAALLMVLWVSRAGSWNLVGHIAATVLLAAYTAYIGRMIAIGATYACGCDIGGADSATRWHLLRTASLFALSSFALLLHLAETSVSLGDSGVAAIAGMTLAATLWALPGAMRTSLLEYEGGAAT